MKLKHNPQLVPFAKDLRKNMTKEEKHLLKEYGLTVIRIPNLEIHKTLRACVTPQTENRTNNFENGWLLSSNSSLNNKCNKQLHHGRTERRKV